MISFGETNQPSIGGVPIGGVQSNAQNNLQAMEAFVNSIPIAKTPTLAVEAEVLAIALACALLLPEPFGLYLLIAVLAYVVLLHRKDILGVLGVSS